MAAKDKPSFDDLAKVSPSNDNDDVPTKKLAPGEEFVAVIRHIERGVGQYNNTVLHLNDLSARDIHEFRVWRRENLNLVSERTQMATLRVFIEWCETIDAISTGLFKKLDVPTVPAGENARSAAASSSSRSSTQSAPADTSSSA